MKPKKLGMVTTVDAETGDVVDVRRNAFTLLPPRGDVCQECATDHAWDQPHNQQSLYYQMHYHSQHGRWPTWTDAMAHCAEQVRLKWRRALRAEMASRCLVVPDDLHESLDGAAPAR